MTIDLDERFPHDDMSGCGAFPVGCSCTRDARIAAHIERLEGALRRIAKTGDWWARTDFGGGDNQMTECAGCGVAMWNQHGFTTYMHGDDCRAPGIRALMAELEGAT